MEILLVVCNVQFVSPDENEDIVAIEINLRVSRSSALLE
jgi:carbamoyl-phosphate synthase large subunit